MERSNLAGKKTKNKKNNIKKCKEEFFTVGIRLQGQWNFHAIKIIKIIEKQKEIKIE